jgi:hypothetical protein
MSRRERLRWALGDIDKKKVIPRQTISTHHGALFEAVRSDLLKTRGRVTNNLNSRADGEIN